MSLFVNNILNEKDIKVKKIGKYELLYYNKSKITEFNDINRQIRSIIIDGTTKQVVLMSPPKSFQLDEFILNNPDFDKIQVEEFIEGTMINIFWNPTIGLSGSWEITTRNNVGANASFFYSTITSTIISSATPSDKSDTYTKTFRDMFLEAAKENNLDFQKLSKAYNFSFVLQHPENRIVVPIKKPQLYLVSAYSIHHDSEECIEIVNHRLSVIKEFQWMNTTIKFPKVYSFSEYSELIDKYGSMNTPYEIMGVVIKNEDTFERTKIRNPAYEEIKLLRGNQPKLQYQYISLRKQGKVKNYLKYYKEHKDMFNDFKKQIHDFTTTLLTNYISCYVKKEKPLIEFPQQYRTHMFNLHQKYLNELREKKQIINSVVVQKYVNEMQSSLLMYCLNFQMRKRNVDTIAVEMELEVKPDDVKMDI